MLNGPDASHVFRSFATRNGRQPTLVELFRELAVEPSGTPAMSFAEPQGQPQPTPAHDPELTAQMQLREMLGLMPAQQNPLLQLLRLSLLLGGGSPNDALSQVDTQGIGSTTHGSFLS